MGDMNYRDYDNRDYDNRDYRDYDYRDYRDYRDDRDYRRDYDRRGGKVNYRNYRNQNYYNDLEMAMEDMREQSRKLEDISEMIDNQQEKTALMKIAQREKEHYKELKNMIDRHM